MGWDVAGKEVPSWKCEDLGLAQGFLTVSCWTPGKSANQFSLILIIYAEKNFSLIFYRGFERMKALAFPLYITKYVENTLHGSEVPSHVPSDKSANWMCRKPAYVRGPFGPQEGGWGAPTWWA